MKRKSNHSHGHGHPSTPEPPWTGQLRPSFPWPPFEGALSSANESGGTRPVEVSLVGFHSFEFEAQEWGLGG